MAKHAHEIKHSVAKKESKPWMSDDILSAKRERRHVGKNRGLGYTTKCTNSAASRLKILFLKQNPASLSTSLKNEMEIRKNSFKWSILSWHVMWKALIYQFYLSINISRGFKCFFHFQNIWYSKTTSVLTDNSFITIRLTELWTATCLWNIKGLMPARSNSIQFSYSTFATTCSHHQRHCQSFFVLWSVSQST